jgi:hypothetical protein
LLALGIAGFAYKALAWPEAMDKKSKGSDAPNMCQLLRLNIAIRPSGQPNAVKQYRSAKSKKQENYLLTNWPKVNIHTSFP